MVNFISSNGRVDQAMQNRDCLSVFITYYTDNCVGKLYKFRLLYNMCCSLVGFYQKKLYTMQLYTKIFVSPC